MTVGDIMSEDVGHLTMVLIIITRLQNGKRL